MVARKSVGFVGEVRIIIGEDGMMKVVIKDREKTARPMLHINPATKPKAYEGFKKIFDKYLTEEQHET